MLENLKDFSGIFETAINFVVHTNCKLEEGNISVPKSFSISNIRSSRSAPEGITDEKRNFEVSYHNAVTDAVLSIMWTRFSSHEKLWADFLLWPKQVFWNLDISTKHGTKFDC